MDAAAFLHAHRADDQAGDGLLLPNWSVEDWRALLSHAQTVEVDSGDALMRLGKQEGALYFVVEGALEVSPSTGRGYTLGPVFRELPGSMFGEVSFFDGLPRSAPVWAIKPTKLLRLSFSGFPASTAQHMTLASELLFAMGRVLAMRLRRGEARNRRRS